MTICTGKSAVLYITSPENATEAAASPMTDSGDHKRYTITNQAKRYWDDTAAHAVVVKVNGVTVTTGFTIEYAGGNIVFDVSQGANPVTADVWYYPYAKWANCTGWTLDVSPKMIDTTVLNMSAPRREAGIKDAKATMEGFHEDDTWFNLTITTNTKIGVVLHESGTYQAAESTGSRYEFYANTGLTINASVTEALKDAVALTVQGPVYYRSA